MINVLLDTQLWITLWRSRQSSIELQSLLKSASRNARDIQICFTTTNFEELLLGIRSSNFTSSQQQLRLMRDVCGRRILPFPSEFAQRDFCSHFSAVQIESNSDKMLALNAIIDGDNFLQVESSLTEWQSHLRKSRPVWRAGVRSVKEKLRLEYGSDQMFRESLLQSKSIFWTEWRARLWQEYLASFLTRFRIQCDRRIEPPEVLASLSTFVCFATSYEGYHSLLARSQLDERSSDYFDLEQMIYLNSDTILVTNDVDVHRIVRVVPESFLGDKVWTVKQLLTRFPPQTP